MAPTRQCDRCRAWVSMDLDAELTEFEQARLRRHLRACADCRAFARDLRSATALLRAARPADLPAQVELPRVRTRRSLQSVVAGVAATAAAVAAVFASGLSGDDQSGPVVLPTAAAGNVDLMTLREQRRAELYLPSAALNNIRVRVVELD
jgi:predicted anti-sigma-YlaC factor YlaD